MKRLFASLCLAVALVPATASAADPPAQLSAKEIAVKAADAGAPASIEETLTMTLVDAKGTKTTRAVSIARKKSGTKAGHATWNTRLAFLSPKDVAGIVLLSLDKGNGSADQYLYLPNLKRTRRVGASQQSAKFQGSDFSYEDLAPRDPDGFDYARLGDEKCGEEDCYAIEAKPAKGTETGYAKTVTLVRKSDFLPLEVRYFDGKGPVKTLTVDGTKVKAQGETRIPEHLEMKSLGDGHTTTLDVTGVKIDPKIDDATFEPASLDRG